ncbi:hypothetical protein CAEBREN_12220 [Caenorhabditis brenneri]|uniref:Uncharacterized protein n=1 Tax=Caenorhabditis brenneri TaxID=135651 RepID=G0MKW5_CAEBE|nr:hypothetical protein CAEBREN_12220 [Caenorhabditis brenneri]
MAPINGFHQENDEALRLRDSFRDEVSKRMGELLLKGQTMLDEYCQTCSGILMEDRTGVRRCVTCEVFQEKTSQIVGEVPLQEEEFHEAADTIPIHEKEKQTAPKKTVIQKAVSSSQKAVPAPKKTKKSVEASKESDTPDAVEAAKEAVLRKLEWAASKLDATEETARVFDFLSIIQKSAETLQALQF